MAKIERNREQDHRNPLVRRGQRYRYHQQQRRDAERDLQNPGVEQGVDAFGDTRRQFAARHPQPVDDD